jgi:hypothetical protein
MVKLFMVLMMIFIFMVYLNALASIYQHSLSLLVLSSVLLSYYTPKMLVFSTYLISLNLSLVNIPEQNYQMSILCKLIKQHHFSMLYYYLLVLT